MPQAIKVKQGQRLGDPTTIEAADWTAEVYAMTAAKQRACVQLLRDAPRVREALRQLVNYLDADPDLYIGDDDGTLGRIMQRAHQALER